MCIYIIEREREREREIYIVWCLLAPLRAAPSALCREAASALPCKFQ